MTPNYKKVHRIIIADDTPAYRELIHEIVQEHLPQAEIETVSDGLDLVNRLNCSEYDLVLTDHQMSQLNGSEAIKTARSYGHLTPMYLVSSEVKLPELAHQAGADGYVHKGSNLSKDLQEIFSKYFPK